MYNRYIPGETGYTRIPPEDGRKAAPDRERPFQTDEGGGGLLNFLRLEKLDTGDILLLLILLLLFLEGDNTELVIVLGLLLLMGLGEDQSA